MLRNTLLLTLVILTSVSAQSASADSYAKTARFDIEAGFARYNKSYSPDRSNWSVGLTTFGITPMWVVTDRFAVGGGIFASFYKSNGVAFDSRSFSLGLSPRLEWTFTSHGKVRPFLLGGASVSHSWSKLESNDAAAPFSAKTRRWSAGPLAGVGLRVFVAERLSIDPWISVSYATAKSSLGPKHRSLRVSLNARLAVWGKPKDRIASAQ